MSTTPRRVLQGLARLVTTKPAATARQVMDDGEVTVVFQPIVDLATREIFAYEALARCKSNRFAGPLPLIQAAIEEGLVGELGHHLRKLSVEGCPDAPLFLNVNPNEFDQGWLVRPDDALFVHAHDVFLEVTESVPLSHFAFVQSVLAELKSKGVRLVIDDFGAGYSNLRYIAELDPQVIKIDMDIIIGISTAPRRQQLVRSFVRLCEDMGSKVVAEGLETAEDLAAVIALGVHYGQGYLLARPANPPPAVKWPEAVAPAPRK